MDENGGCGIIPALFLAVFLAVAVLYFAVGLIILGILPFVVIIWIGLFCWHDSNSRRTKGIILLVTAVLCMGCFHEEHKIYLALTEKPTMYVPHHIHMIKGQYNEDVVKNMVGKGTTVKESYNYGAMIEEPNLNSAQQEFNKLYAEAQRRHLNLSKLPEVTFYQLKYIRNRHLTNKQAHLQMYGMHQHLKYEPHDLFIGTATFKGHHGPVHNSGEGSKVSDLAQKDTSVNRTRDKLNQLKYDIFDWNT